MIPNSNNVSPLFIERRPDWAVGVDLDLSHQTAVLASRSGLEQRSRARATPVARITWTERGLTLAQYQQRQARVAAEIASPCVVPFWTERATLSANMTSTTARINQTPRPDFFAPGQWVYIAANNTASGEFREIVSVDLSSNTLTLNAGAFTAYSSGAYIYPARLCRRVQGQDSLKRYTFRSFDERLTFETIDGGTDFPEDARTMPFPSFAWIPDFAEPPEHNHTTTADVLRFATAPPLVTWPDLRTERSTRFQFALDAQSDLVALKRFFQARGGQHQAFLMPTWERDFTVFNAPATGTNAVLVNVADYAGDYLASTAWDAVGWFIYVFDPVEGLHMARVIRSTTGSEPDTSLLELVEDFPFAPDATAVWGFVRLVRFADDSLRLRHSRPGVAVFELPVKTIRQRVVFEESLSLVGGVDQYNQVAFTAAVLEPENAPKLRLDYSHADGPRNLHFNQDDQFVDRWAAWLGTNSVRLAKAADGTIWPPDDSTGTPSNLFPFGPPATNHLSLAFDQNSWEVIAWEDGLSNVSVKRRYNGALVQHTFPGRSPQLYNNGVVDPAGKLAGLSDVVCYYTRPNQNCIFVRFQRDQFNTEYVLNQGPSKALVLYHTDTDGGTISLVYVDDGFRRVTLTAVYPEPEPIPPNPYVSGEFEEEASTGMALRGDYWPEIITAEDSGDEATVGMMLHGEYFDTVIEDEHTEEAAASMELRGQYLNLFPPTEPLEERGTLAMEARGLYSAVIQAAPPDSETASLGMTLRGTYAP